MNEGITNIGDYAFYHVRLHGIMSGVGLFWITLPESLETIGDCAFKECWIIDPVIPSNVTYIGHEAFKTNYFNTMTMRPLLPPTVMEDSFDWVFDKIYVPAESLEAYRTAPVWCDHADALVPVDDMKYSGTIGNVVWDYKDGVMTLSKKPGAEYGDTRQYRLYEKAWNEAYPKLTKELVVGPDVRTIGDFVFKDFKSLETVTFSEGLEGIRMWAFAGCDSLKSVAFPESVRNISSSAFRDCSSLEKITFEGDLGRIKIDRNAFAISSPECIVESSDIRAARSIMSIHDTTTKFVFRELPKESELTPVTYIWLNYDYTVIKTVPDVPWGQDPTPPESPVHPDGREFYGWNEESATGYKVFLAKF